jgi:hypothetical protein
MRSFLALAPWMAFILRGWPSTKGICSCWHRSASRYQANMHSTPMTSPPQGGGDGAEESIRPGGQVAVEGDDAVVVEDANVHGPGVQVDAEKESVLLRIESHGGLRVGGRCTGGVATSSVPAEKRPG